MKRIRSAVVVLVMLLLFGATQGCKTTTPESTQEHSVPTLLRLQFIPFCPSAGKDYTVRVYYRNGPIRAEDVLKVNVWCDDEQSTFDGSEMVIQTSTQFIETGLKTRLPGTYTFKISLTLTQGETNQIGKILKIKK